MGISLVRFRVWTRQVPIPSSPPHDRVSAYAQFLSDFLELGNTHIRFVTFHLAVGLRRNSYSMRDELLRQVTFQAYLLDFLSDSHGSLRLNGF